MIPSWPTRAACRDADEELFASAELTELREAHAGSPKALPRIQKAFSYCGRCRVKTDCGDYAVGSTDYAMFGVWGGEYITYPVAEKRQAAARKRAWKKEDTVPETDAKEDYAVELAALLERFVTAVHADLDDAGPALEAARALPGPGDVDPNTAIQRLLAAMVNPKSPRKELTRRAFELVAEPDRLNPAETQAA